MSPDDAPAELQCAGWGQSQLRHGYDIQLAMLDFGFKSCWEWYYMRINAWIIEFFDQRSWQGIAKGNVRPVGWVDLRKILAVHVGKVAKLDTLYEAYTSDPFLVSLNQSDGDFGFRVASSAEADLWAKAIEQRIYENSTNKHASHIVLELKRRTMSPEQERSVHDIWMECVRCVADGESPHPSLWAEMFALYDHDRDGNMGNAELSCLIRDLTEVRHKNLLEFLAREEQRLRDCEPSALGVSEKNYMHGSLSQMQISAEHLLSIYQESEGPGFNRRMFKVRQMLDISRDGSLSFSEFSKGAHEMIFCKQVLELEAQFYQHKIPAPTGSMHGGCTQQ